MTDVPPGRTRYDFQHEAQRIVEALNLKGASMTLMCALQEAFDAGLRSAAQKEEKPVCRVCGGYGFIAQKRSIDDGFGEVDSCPACEDPTPDTEPKP